MATPNINVVLQSIIAVTNNLITPAPQIINFDFQNPTMPSTGTGGTVAYFDPYFQALTGGSAVNLPVAKVFALAVQNIASAGLLTVSYTPFGGSATSINIGPNGVLLLFDPAESGTGISAVTLTGNGGTIPAAVLVAA